MQAIELEVKTLAFTDAATGTALDLDTYVKTVTLKVDGQQVADKSTLATAAHHRAPRGCGARPTSSRRSTRACPPPCTPPPIMVVPQTPKPPDRLKVDYDAQPTLVLGTGKINL